MNHRTNNLDGLRLFGAMLVIFGHVFVLFDRRQDDPLVMGYRVETLGVVIFFAISGYLVSASWESKRDFVEYFAARSLRIFPALIVVVVVTALILGPLATSLPARIYFSSPLVWDYFSNISLHISHRLPGVTDSLPFPHSINAALWTLAMEFTCYLIVPLVAIRRWRGRVILLLAALLPLVWLANQPKTGAPVVWGMRTPQFAHFAELFMAGALIRACVERFGRGFLRADVAVSLAGVHLVVMELDRSLVHWVGWMTMPYVVLTLGLARTPIVSDASRHGDFSYGLYLWAFPVQQLLLLWVGPTHLLVDLSIVTAITLVLAMASWHFVEKPCLAAKDRILRQRRQPPTTLPLVGDLDLDGDGEAVGDGHREQPLLEHPGLDQLIRPGEHGEALGCRRDAQLTGQSQGNQVHRPVRDAWEAADRASAERGQDRFAGTEAEHVRIVVSDQSCCPGPVFVEQQVRREPTDEGDGTLSELAGG